MEKSFYVYALSKIQKIVKNSQEKKVSDLLKEIPKNYFLEGKECILKSSETLTALDNIREFEKFYNIILLENNYKKINLVNSFFYITCINQLSELESFNFLYNDELTEENKNKIFDEIENILKFYYVF